MTEDHQAGRRKRIATAVSHTTAHASAGDDLRRFLEEPVRNQVDGDAFPVLEPGSSNPIMLFKKNFFSLEDGKRHNGLFDALGHPSDLPFMTSKWSE